MTTTVSITDNAARKIALQISKESKPNSKLRISVEGGGCSGFKYVYEFVTETSPEDTIIEKSGAIIVIDEISLSLLKGSTIDFIETLGESRIEIKNPNSGSRCGCGNSFGI